MKDLSTKHKQLLTAGFIGACGLLITGVLIWSLGDVNPQPQGLPTSETRIETAGSRVNPQEVWVERMESAHKLTNQKLEALEKLMLAGAQGLQKAEEKSIQLAEELSALKEAQEAQEKMKETLQEQDKQGDPFSGEAATPQGIKKIVLQLASGGKDKKATIEHTLPAGTFARGVLLGGVDASTATNAPSDPRPVLIRITDPGTLPRKFKSDLKDCHILASCYGDLSSERVYMRLEKLTSTERRTGDLRLRWRDTWWAKTAKQGFGGLWWTGQAPLFATVFWGDFSAASGNSLRASHRLSHCP